MQRISNKEQEGLMKRKELERQLEEGMAESTSLRNDLRLALQRIADLQQAMEQADEDDEDPSARYDFILGLKYVFSSNMLSIFI